MLNRILEWLKKTVFKDSAYDPPMEVKPVVNYRL